MGQMREFLKMILNRGSINRQYDKERYCEQTGVGISPESVFIPQHISVRDKRKNNNSTASKHDSKNRH